MYTYECIVEKVIDGDTLDVTVDLGFCVSIQQRVRLYGVNAPEVHGAERFDGKAATDFVKRLVEVSQNKALIKSHKSGNDKYGRWLAEVQLTRADGTVFNLSDEMIRAGHAQPFMVD